jgi:putative zinc finger/helix-turn-helix YgiT family protein
MKCFDCDKGKLASKLADVSGEVRGEKYTVHCEAMVCDRCGFRVLSEEQSDAYTAAMSDAYRERHGILTSKKLKQVRARLGLSQQAFADYLKVGVASVKRWESGLIQDEAMDELIRLRTDLSIARRNVKELKARLAAESQPQVPVVGIQRRRPEAQPSR